MTPHSAIGFGPADWFEFVVAGLLVASAFLWNSALKRRLVLLSANAKIAIPLLFALPIVLRLLLLPRHGIPVPNVYDEFSHLLVADTLLHLRLANPPHPLHRFFETFFVLQQPTYSSIYPLGQGLMLAFGRALSGTAWTGVLLATGSLCAGSYWALRAYVSPPWAFLGGLLAVIQFGPLNLWMNSYWGGSLPAAAGCLVFGALPRLGRSWMENTTPRRRHAALLGIGLGAHLLTRPFETTLLALCVALFPLTLPLGRLLFRRMLPSALLAFLTLLPAVILTACHNRQVTGSWITLPEQLSQYQYGVPTTFTVQLPAAPRNRLTPQQSLEFKAQFMMHGTGVDSLSRFHQRFEYRIRDYRFFFSAPLYLAAACFLFALRQKLYCWVALSLAIFALGTNLFPYLLSHYLAAVTVLFLLVSIIGLQQIRRLQVRGVSVGSDIVRVILLLTFGQFLLWYSLHLFEGAHPRLVLLQFETWDTINHRLTELRSTGLRSTDHRATVAAELAAIPGKLLVLVHYSPHHIFQDEWVWNEADIDRSRIVMARDLGSAANEKIIAYYPDRKVLFFEPDAQPPTLTSGHAQ